MTENLEAKLQELKTLEDQLNLVGEQKDKIRKEVLEILQEENIKTFKNDVATISQVERKTITFVTSKESVLERLEKDNNIRFFDVVPEEIIPEHKELNKEFDKAVKSGELAYEDIELKVTYSPMIKFK
jgi:hypothetical protein